MGEGGPGSPLPSLEAPSQPRTHRRRRTSIFLFLGMRPLQIQPNLSLNGSQELSAAEMFCASLGNAAQCCPF